MNVDNLGELVLGIMMRMQHRFWTAGIAGMAVAAVLLFPGTASAHLGGGPPYFSVNGVDSQTNASYLSGPTFVMPLDFGPDKYLVNQPIQFKIDLTKLPVPYEVAKESTFRWTWDDGASPADTGAEL